MSTDNARQMAALVTYCVDIRPLTPPLYLTIWIYKNITIFEYLIHPKTYNVS